MNPVRCGASVESQGGWPKMVGAEVQLVRACMLRDLESMMNLFRFFVADGLLYSQTAGVKLLIKDVVSAQDAACMA